MRADVNGVSYGRAVRVFLKRRAYLQALDGAREELGGQIMAATEDLSEVRDHLPAQLNFFE